MYTGYQIGRTKGAKIMALVDGKKSRATQVLSGNHGSRSSNKMMHTSSTHFVSKDKVITFESMNSKIKTMEYAVRGPLVIRATEIEKEIANGVKKPFPDVIRANIGDAHAMEQKPITFIRQVLSLITYPQSIETANFPEDVKNKAKEILKGCRGGSVGAYSDTPSFETIRRHAAQYIERRDGVPANYEDIFLCGGATDGIRSTLKLFVDAENKTKPGVMIPTPQYPLYSASLAEFGLGQINYYLDESKNWAMDVSELKRSIQEARDNNIVPRVLVVINPGNPTGQVVTRENIADIIRFAYDEKLFLMADEVYQDNVYAEGSKFFSFKKVLKEMGPPYDQMELASYFSASKGYMGECGLRGGYYEVINMDRKVRAMLLKSVSAKLCPTVLGQATMDCIVDHPKPGDPSYALWHEEKTGILDSLAQRAKMIEETFNKMPGIQCNPVQGAMYAFPQLTLPPKALAAAKSKNQPGDTFYAFELLEQTGICIIPGTGFGQYPGTYHFRTTILPQPAMLKSMLERFEAFHIQFMKKYS